MTSIAVHFTVLLKPSLLQCNTLRVLNEVYFP